MSARGSAAILVYHSVAAVDRDPFGLAVTPDDFRRHMEILATRVTPLSLEDLCHGLDAGKLPDRCVAVTFDDGYANNLIHALPALRAYGIPATVFVATGSVDSRREFWWDELERLLAESADAVGQGVLTLRLGDDSLRCQMDGTHMALMQLWRSLVARPAGEIEEGLAQLRRWAGATAERVPRDSHRPMSLSELQELAGAAEIEIGAHTRRHPQLGARTEAEQREEIHGSRADLQAWLGTAPASFAYPYGNPANDYGAPSVALVQAGGFRRAVSTVPRLARDPSERFELPRYFVTARAAAQFERWLGDRFRSLPRRAAGKLARQLRSR